jgi:hypothetical protein
MQLKQKEEWRALASLHKDFQSGNVVGRLTEKLAREGERRWKDGAKRRTAPAGKQKMRTG